jgi:GNAT superfamily N-acetyltransferase
MTLRPARIDELEILSALCLRSKAVWGYDRAFIDACRTELTLAPADLLMSEIQVVERDGSVVGVAQISLRDGLAQLEKLFVEPEAMRTGAGRALLNWARDTARKAGASALIIEADPGAAAFYRRMGAHDDGLAPSGSIAGRYLPRLKLCL